MNVNIKNIFTCVLLMAMAIHACKHNEHFLEKECLITQKMQKIYSKKSLDSKILATLPRGRRVITIAQTYSKWSKIIFPIEGWAKLAACSTIIVNENKVIYDINIRAKGRVWDGIEKATKSRGTAVFDNISVFVEKNGKKKKHYLFSYKVGYEDGVYWQHEFFYIADINHDGLDDFLIILEDDLTHEYLLFLSEKESYLSIDLLELAAKEAGENMISNEADQITLSINPSTKKISLHSYQKKNGILGEFNPRIISWNIKQETLPNQNYSE